MATIKEQIKNPINQSISHFNLLNSKEFDSELDRFISGKDDFVISVTPWDTEEPINIKPFSEVQIDGDDEECYKSDYIPIYLRNAHKIYNGEQIIYINLDMEE